MTQVILVYLSIKGDDQDGGYNNHKASSLDQAVASPSFVGIPLAQSGAGPLVYRPVFQQPDLILAICCSRGPVPGNF